MFISLLATMISLAKRGVEADKSKLDSETTNERKLQSFIIQLMPSNQHKKIYIYVICVTSLYLLESLSLSQILMIDFNKVRQVRSKKLFLWPANGWLTNG